MDALGRSLVIKLAVAGVLLCVAWMAYFIWTENLDDSDSLELNSSLNEQSPVTKSKEVIQKTSDTENDSEIDFAVRPPSESAYVADTLLEDPSLEAIRRQHAEDMAKNYVEGPLFIARDNAIVPIRRNLRLRPKVRKVEGEIITTKTSQ